jgi:hypothetical protein
MNCILRYLVQTASAEAASSCMTFSDEAWSQQPSTLHQMLIQWVGDDIEQVHADVSACITVADAPVLWTYETATCLTGVDFSDYQFISIDKKGFIPIMLEPMENRLNPK